MCYSKGVVYGEVHSRKIDFHAVRASWKGVRLSSEIEASSILVSRAIIKDSKL